MPIEIINRYALYKAERGDEALEDLGLDCIDKMSIALDIEEERGVYVSDADIERWVHVSDVARVVS